MATLPKSFSDLYPNRFLHADQLQGKKFTLTVADIKIEELEGEKGVAAKVVVYFKETQKHYVMPKTNGFCFKRMFGGDPNGWIGKRVTWFPTTTKFGRETVDCIRVWGSPDIPADISVTVPNGRKKPVEMVLHKVAPGECGFKGTPAPAENQDAEPSPQPAVDFVYQPEGD